MTITLDLQPEVEKSLLAQARSRGVSVADFVKEIVDREAKVPKSDEMGQTGQVLVDACALVRGLADDLDLTRNPSTGRTVDFS